MLPHVRGRIVTMRRFPDGIDGKSFYQKQVPDYFPDWIETVQVTKQGGRLRELVIDNPETLAYLANQACIAVHVWPSRAEDPHRPDRLIFDLDPSVDDFGRVRDAARVVRSILEDTGLTPHVMTTGSRGLHVVAPLDARTDFDAARRFAAAVAELVVAKEPDRFTVEHRKRKRGERVFIDYLRNAYAQHGIAPYSVRAKPGAPVATPLTWDELGRADLDARRYTIRNLFRRLARKEDPWKDIARHAGSLADAHRRLERLRALELAAR
jgi:bifunctional non-homologous end joining protein LigD